VGPPPRRDRDAQAAIIATVLMAMILAALLSALW